MTYDYIPKPGRVRPAADLFVSRLSALRRGAAAGPCRAASLLSHVEIDDAEGQRDDLDMRKATRLQQLAEFLRRRKLPDRFRQVRVRAVVAGDHPPDDGQHAACVPQVQRTESRRG